MQVFNIPFNARYIQLNQELQFVRWSKRKE